MLLNSMALKLKVIDVLIAFEPDFRPQFYTIIVYWSLYSFVKNLINISNQNEDCKIVNHNLYESFRIKLQYSYSWYE